MNSQQTEIQQTPESNGQHVPQVTNGKRIEAWYEHDAGVYWLPSKGGNYIKYNESGLKRCLKAAGFLSRPYAQQLVSEMDSEILRIQNEQNVNYAGPFAGYPTGICAQYEKRVLVTEARRAIEPVPGAWPIVAKLFENLFTDPDYREQRPYIFGWIKIAIECLRQGLIRPGQLLVIAGERDCGKSLCQNLITKIFGGRAARPYRYMSGETTFNGDLIGAEHLIIEDDAGSTDIRVRRQFGSKIKELTVNELQSCHPKNCNAFPARIFWRVSASLNCEPENLATLPPLDDSLLDKIILLKACKRELPMKTRTHEEREAFWNTMVAELPAFIHHLLQWNIPVELQSPRFGVTHYHHPELLESLQSLAPEIRLLELIDSHYWPRVDPGATIQIEPRRNVTATAQEIEEQLISGLMSHAARKLLNWGYAVGTYLGRLAVSHPKRVQYNRTSARREWTIQPPETTPENPAE